MALAEEVASMAALVGAAATRIKGSLIMDYTAPFIQQ
jgi:hypothetical protein